MYIKEQYIMHHIAYELIQNGGYDILHINEHEDEIWLEKYKNRNSNVIRLKNQGFDWKNDLKKDISKTFQKTAAIEKLFVGKQVNISNIYIATYPPVDSWQVLKRPIQHSGRKQMNMHVYYITEESYEAELARISKDITPIPAIQSDADPVILEGRVKNYSHFLHQTLKNEKEKIQSVFSYGKPIFTYILLVMNILFFLIIEWTGSSTEIPDLIRFGAKYNPAIMDGEWWRIVSAMFIHIGFLHLFMNMLALYYLGTGVERIYGSTRFILIYFLAGLGGGIASFALTINVAAGASGAIFGLFGALLFFGLHQRKLFLQTMGRGVLFLIVFNIMFGFFVPQIDNSAHLGGLIAGFLSSAIFHLPNMRQVSKQIMAVVIYGLMITTLIFYGLQNGNNNAMYHLDKIDPLLEVERYEEIVLHADQGLKKDSNDELKTNLYFQRAYAYIHLQEAESAIADLEKSVTINPKFERSYFNLAVLYYDTGNIELAKDAVKEAYQLNPNDEAYKDLYEKITGESP